MGENIESFPQSSYKSVYQERMQREHKLQNITSEESCLDGPNDINKTLVIQKDIALEKSMGQYEDEIMPLVDSRPYVQTTIGNFDNLTASQKFTSCHELLSHSAGSEFHITDEELIECCNKAEVTMKEVNTIDAPEGTHDDNKKKTIVDIIFEDFSTMPFNSPVVSPESKLRNLDRSPLFILREIPKHYYSRKFRVKAKSNLEEKFKAAIDDNDDNSIQENRGYIEKEDTYNVNETLVSSNQCKTGISENWNEDDDDIFASIILDENEKISKFQENKQIIQGFQTANGIKISISEESKISIQNILREFQDDLQETNYETELKDIKAQLSKKSMEAKFRTTATRKRLMTLNDESNQTGHSNVRNVPKFRKKHLSLNPKFNSK
ncbi:uncharacterized protein ACN427_001242 [Glossina fuscipes fuscipes]